MTTHLGYTQDDGKTGLGIELREARLGRGVSLDDAQRATRISRRYLEALEDEDFSILPAPVFARGFLRSYAQFLGLDASRLVTLFPGEPRPLDTLPDPHAVGLRVAVGPQRRRRPPEQLADPFDPFRPQSDSADEDLTPIPTIDTRPPGVRLGPWLVAAVVLLVVLAGVVAVVTLGDDEPAATPLGAPPGVAEAGTAIDPQAVAERQPTIDLDVMPDFRPLAVSQAVEVLRRSAHQYVIVEVFDAATPAGEILEQMPVPGAALDDSSTVTLVVSRGPVPLTPITAPEPAEAESPAAGTEQP